MDNINIQPKDTSKGHFYVSLAKSALRVVAGGEEVDKKDARCIDCGQPFKFGVNIFTKEGFAEIAISGTCEKCFDSYFEGVEE